MSTNVRRTLIAIPTQIREWTNYLSGLFFAREFTTILTGCDTDQTGTIRYTVSAGIVCLSLPDLAGESNSTVSFLTGLPEEITPNHDQLCLARVVNNGVTTVGIVQVGIDTGITLFADLDGGAFASSGTKGLKYSVICYALD